MVTAETLTHILIVLFINEKPILRKNTLLAIEKCLSPMPFNNIIMLQHLIIQFPLHYLSSGHLRRLKTKETFKLLALKVVVTKSSSLTKGSKYSDLTWKLLVFGDLGLGDVGYKDMGTWGRGDPARHRDAGTWRRGSWDFGICGDLKMWDIDVGTPLALSPQVPSPKVQWPMSQSPCPCPTF